MGVTAVRRVGGAGGISMLPSIAPKTPANPYPNVEFKPTVTTKPSEDTSLAMEARENWDPAGSDSSMRNAMMDRGALSIQALVTGKSISQLSSQMLIKV